MSTLDINQYPFESNDWLFYSRNIFKHAGWKAFYKQFWKHIRRPWSRRKINNFAPTGCGLEIGCGTWTIAPTNRTILSDAFSSHAGNSSLAKVFFDAASIPYSNESFSFILSEHVLEHIYDPITTLEEWKRVLQKKGKVFIFLPHKDRMFDKKRKTTEFTHLRQRLSGNTEIIKQQILEEWMSEVINKGLADHYRNIEPSQMITDGTIHFNVWRPNQVETLLHETGFNVLEVEEMVPDRKDSFLVIAEKKDQ